MLKKGLQIGYKTLCRFQSRNLNLGCFFQTLFARKHSYVLYETESH